MHALFRAFHNSSPKRLQQQSPQSEWVFEKLQGLGMKLVTPAPPPPPPPRLFVELHRPNKLNLTQKSKVILFLN